MKQRELSIVPKFVWFLLAISFIAQILWQTNQKIESAQAEDLPQPPDVLLIKLIALGDAITAAKFLNLWLQAFDNQPGISIPFNQLDYDKVIYWLDTINTLDPKGKYPMFVASNVYASVNDLARVRKILVFIESKYQKNPDLHWRWMADAALTAKHRLKDLPLALSYANKLANNTAKGVPYWVRDMQLVILEDMNELHALKILIGGLIDKGEITDVYELHYLQQKLLDVEKRLSE